MTPRREASAAALVVRLLLDEPIARDVVASVDWPTLLRSTRGSAALVRTADRLVRLGVRPPADFTAVVERERHRIAAALDLAARVGRVCAERGIAAMFPKAFQHAPDLGDDLDLLVLARSPAVDALILDGLPHAQLRRDLGSRIAGTRAYRVQGYATPLDIQHGRLGTAGEETTFPALLWAARRPVTVGGVELSTASPEHYLVLQGLQRVYGRIGIDLGDVVSAAVSIRRDALDWESIVETATVLGVLPGVSCFLAYVDRIHAGAVGRPLLPPAAGARLRLAGWGHTPFRAGRYRYPVLRVNATVYGQKLAGALARRRWTAAARLCLVPVIAVERTLRRLSRPLRPVEVA